VEDQNGDPASWINVAVEISPAIPAITPEEETTDADGRAIFKVTAIDLPDNDGSILEYLVIARALHPTDSSVKRGEQSLVIYIVDAELVPDGPTSRDYQIPELALVVSAFLIAAVAIGLYRRRLKR
ncbi:MAG: hypothetical protein KAX31_02445, partial [Thermoplasmata archaeon]|nr:hypothetical protein [Thermoplasmata archaeon]